MDIWYWPYELVPKRPLSALTGEVPRQGALIRAGGGFGDVHPWPELGDARLGRQLDLLRLGETTPLTRRSLAMARLDGEGREHGRSLFDGITVPASHWPLAAGEVPPAFDTVKVKMSRGSKLDPYLARYHLRLDFNATLDAGEFIELVRGLSGALRNAIDFVEDPCPYDGARWEQIRKDTGVRLALDRRDGTRGVDVLVVKPAVQDVAEFLSRQSTGEASTPAIVVTSYMDHPIGQLGAAYIAATVPVSTCGLITHVLYENDPFIERMKVDGTRLAPVEGAGVGFDDILGSLPWKKLT